MTPTDARVRAAELRLPFPAVEALFLEERQRSADHVDRSRALRAWIHGFYGGPAAFYSRFLKGNRGDHSTIPQFDEWSTTAAAEWPDVFSPGDDPAAALWEFLQTPADRSPTAAELWEKAFTRALEESGARAIDDSADLISVDDAAALADVTPQWIRSLAKSGRIPGRRVGSVWLVSRSAALAFKRHPTAGRPRRSPGAAADCPF